MANVTFSLSMLHSAVSVLSEAARQVEDRGTLDQFLHQEVPLALADARAALQDLEAIVQQGHGETV